MRRILLTLAAAFCAVPVAAEPPDRISLHLGSAHFGVETDFEEINPGVFLTWERRLNYSVGAFRNSYGRMSVAATAGYDLWEQGRARLEVFGGLAHYPKDGRRLTGWSHDFVPLVGLRAHYDPVFISVLPGDGDTMDGVVTFGLTFDYPG